MRIEWEYDLVERPFCEQLRAMGWEWIEGDPDLPETTERSSSSEVLLKGRLAAALRKLNLRAGQPWLDDGRIARSHTRALHRNLRKALPNAAIIGFTGTPILSEEKTETREIFGELAGKSASSTSSGSSPRRRPTRPTRERMAQ